MKVEKIYFNTEDGAELFGLLHTNDEVICSEVVISTHGMGSNCFKKRDDIIAHKLTDNGIAYFTYNNRGYEIITATRINGKKEMQGTVFEDVKNSYYDVKAAIEAMRKKGFSNINLQGHSLGSTKTVYSYNKFIDNKEEEILNSIKSVILLSLVDLSEVMTYLVHSNKDVNVPEIALKEENSKNYIIETQTPFMPFVSPKTFLRYYRDNEEFDFAKYTTPDYTFSKLNNIKVPIFMRWGNVNELISIPAEYLAELMNKKIINEQKDISFVDGATHNYFEKEDELAEQILKFIKNKNGNID